ncbi:unnamed protein product [Wuchereria bancrofti]|uniref:Uncharacterized protein n=1 Tax=Wuchereria bancrofti TaxID=6293 RepID=A0A3P7E8G4_WUCBA|nr:unnamed protein product [Wuchereria bancrofti]
MLLPKRRAMKKENQMVMLLYANKYEHMKRDFKEFRHLKKRKTLQKKTQNMLEEETNLKDFEREVEEELFEGNAAKKDAISSRFFEIALKKVQQKKWKE